VADAVIEALFGMAKTEISAMENQGSPQGEI